MQSGKRRFIVRNVFAGVFSAALIALVFSPLVNRDSQGAQDTPNARSSNQKFDPHDITGTWRGDNPRPGIRNFASWDQTIPEPPLTEWGKQHLLYKSISHDPQSGPPLPGKDRPGHLCPNNN